MAGEEYSIEFGRALDDWSCLMGPVCGIDPLEASRMSAGFSFEGASGVGRSLWFQEFDGSREWLVRLNVALRLSLSLRRRIFAEVSSSPV